MQVSLRYDTALIRTGIRSPSGGGKMMSWKRGWIGVVVLVSLLVGVTSCGKEKPPEPPKAAPPPPFTFGVVLVGPYNDHGWSEAHYAAGKYVESKGS
jgi:hypothetical protein